MTMNLPPHILEQVHAAGKAAIGAQAQHTSETDGFDPKAIQHVADQGERIPAQEVTGLPSSDINKILFGDRGFKVGPGVKSGGRGV